MAKKKTAGSPTPDAAPERAASAEPRRGRTAAKSAAVPAETPDLANDRSSGMPEAAGQRVTTADSSDADSVTFVSVTMTSPTYEQIAEAAYQRYLSRGGSDGRDFDDWLEAERELKSK
jgi:hypothetical protein